MLHLPFKHLASSISGTTFVKLELPSFLQPLIPPSVSFPPPLRLLSSSAFEYLWFTIKITLIRIFEQFFSSCFCFYLYCYGQDFTIIFSGKKVSRRSLCIMQLWMFRAKNATSSLYHKYKRTKMTFLEIRANLDHLILLPLSVHLKFRGRRWGTYHPSSLSLHFPDGNK